MAGQVLETGTTASHDRTVDFEGKLIPLDMDGYLVNAEDWSEGFATHLAALDGMTLLDDQWQVINFIREYYVRFESAPMAKVLVKGLNQKLGSDQFSIKALHKLYPDHPLRRSCRYAGVPQPAGCT